MSSNKAILKAALDYCEKQLAIGKTSITVWELIELGILPCVERTRQPREKEMAT